MQLEQKKLLGKIARMYYDANLKQSDIAKRLGLERSTISKYLKKARELNIVRIEISDDFFQEIEAKLESLYGLKQVRIVPTTSTSADQYEELGQAGGEMLQQLIRHHSVVGFNWGRSMSAISQYIRKHQVAKVEADFVPIVGGCNHNDSKLHGNYICYSLAQSFAAKCHPLYAPVITTTEAMKEELNHDPLYQEITALWNKLDLAFVGIGSPKSSSNVIWNTSLVSEDIIDSTNEDAVGETCTRFYDKQGQEITTSLTHRTVAIELQALKNIEYVIGVACGLEKVEAIRSAIEGKLINILITDEKTAMKLLEND